MSRLLLISLGSLGGMILEAAARAGDFDEIVVASRSPGRAQKKVNNARIGGAIEGRFPAITCVPFDLHAEDAPARLARIAPDVALAAPSMMPWWVLDTLEGEIGAKARAVPFAGFMACHLAPVARLRDAWAASGLACPWINASYPDVINAVLARTGPAPLCGVGNVVEAIPKFRFVIAEALGAEPGRIAIKLVAQHALEYYIYSDGQAAERPPYLLEATLDGRDVSHLAGDAVYSAFPVPYELDFNLYTVSAAMIALPALVSDDWTPTHVPGPEGLVGGYPVALSRQGLRLDLPAAWTRAEAETVNHASMRFDGVADIEADGTVVYTDETAAALGHLLGRRVECLRLADAPALADELRAAVGAG